MSELRYDPAKKTWVIIATERGMRPVHVQRYDSGIKPVSKSICPFCPGNEDRTPPEIMSLKNPEAGPDAPRWQVRVIPNKFPALTIETPQERFGKGIYDVVSGFGAHEVIVETPSDEEQMADFSVSHLRNVFSVYRDRLADLKRDSRFRYIMIFKNYGAEAGASLCHSHSQIIAIPVNPSLIAVELSSSRDYYRYKERCMTCDIIHQELDDSERIVINEEYFVAFTPFASSFPFELRIAPKIHNHDFSTIDEDHLQHFAAVVKELLQRLRKVLDDPPFNFILHTSPPVNPRPAKPEYWTSIAEDYHWHLDLTPRMTMIAGFEWGTGFQINPTSPEDAARFLRDAEI